MISATDLLEMCRNTKGMIVSDAMVMSEPGPYGRVVKSTRFIPNGTVLMNIPREFILTGKKEMDLVRAMDKAQNDPNGVFPWHSYISALPTEFPTMPIDLPKKVLRCLPKVMSGSFKQTMKLLKNVPESHIKLYFQAMTRIYEERSYKYGNAFIPGVDLFNHNSQNCNIEVEFLKDRVRVTALTDIAQDTELLNDYGFRLPVHSAISYGFLNESDYTLIPTATKFPKTKLFASNNCTNPDENMDLVYFTKSGAPSQGLFRCLSLVALQKLKTSHASYMKQFLKSQLSETRKKTLEAKVYDLIRNEVELELPRYEMPLRGCKGVTHPTIDLANRVEVVTSKFLRRIFDYASEKLQSLYN
jgi:hypothetical protein